MENIYGTVKWRDVRLLALERDAFSCTAEDLDAEGCLGLLHVHHIDPNGDPYDLDNLIVICAGHHARLHSFQRRWDELAAA